MVLSSLMVNMNSLHEQECFIQQHETTAYLHPNNVGSSTFVFGRPLLQQMQHDFVSSQISDSDRSTWNAWLFCSIDLLYIPS